MTFSQTKNSIYCIENIQKQFNKISSKKLSELKLVLKDRE